MSYVELPRKSAATITANAALVAGWHTPVDATSGAITVTLPASATPGATLSVEKRDSSANAVIVSGTILGTVTTTTMALRHSSITFTADSAGTSWTPTAGRVSEASLSKFGGLVQVSNASGDAATILAAITAQTTAGKSTGTFATVQGALARISSPTTINLGYTNTQAANWATDTTIEKVRIKLDILPDAGLGAALTIKGGYGVELDLNVLGGGTRGTVTDATVSAGSNVVSSPTAIAAGLQPGAVVFIAGAGPVPEGVVQPRAATVRTVNSGAGTFTISEAAEVAVTNASMNWFDVAVRVEDCVGLKLNIYGKGFQGYLLAADATDDTTKRLRSCTLGDIVGNGCGGTIFFKSIEAFGTIGHIMSNTIYGDYFGQGADLHWDHWEGGVPLPTSQLARAYLWFDRYGQVNNLSVSAGDRATEAAVLLTGNTGSNVGSMGRFSQIRATMYQATAQAAITSGTNTLTNVTSNSLTMRVGMTVMGPGIPDGTTITAVTGTGSYTGGATGTVTMSANATASNSNTQVYGSTSEGLKIIGVTGVDITHLDTARSIVGLHIIGGGSTGIRVLDHVSYSSDLRPLYVEGGTSGTPRVRINADYRFHGGYSVDLASSLTSGAEVRIEGHIEGGHQFDGGASGKYVARSASTATVLDVSGLRSKLLSGASGFIDSTTVTLRGRPNARLENEVPTAGQVWETDGSGGFALANPGSAATGVLAVLASDVVVTNTTTETPLISYTVLANTPQAGTTYRIHVAGNAAQGVNTGTLTFRLRYGGVSGASIGNSTSIAQVGSGTTRPFSFTFDVTFRGSGASVVLAVSNVYFAPGTSGAFSADSSALSTTVDKTLSATVTWATADVTNVVTAVQGTIELIKA